MMEVKERKFVYGDISIKFTPCDYDIIKSINIHVAKGSEEPYLVKIDSNNNDVIINDIHELNACTEKDEFFTQLKVLISDYDALFPSEHIFFTRVCFMHDLMSIQFSKNIERNDVYAITTRKEWTSDAFFVSELNPYLPRAIYGEQQAYFAYSKKEDAFYVIRNGHIQVAMQAFFKPSSMFDYITDDHSALKRISVFEIPFQVNSDISLAILFAYSTRFHIIPQYKKNDGRINATVYYTNSQFDMCFMTTDNLNLRFMAHPIFGPLDAMCRTIEGDGKRIPNKVSMIKSCFNEFGYLLNYVKQPNDSMEPCKYVDVCSFITSAFSEHSQARKASFNIIIDKLNDDDDIDEIKIFDFSNLRYVDFSDYKEEFFDFVETHMPQLRNAMTKDIDIYPLALKNMHQFLYSVEDVYKYTLIYSIISASNACAMMEYYGTNYALSPMYVDGCDSPVLMPYVRHFDNVKTNTSK